MWILVNYFEFQDIETSFVGVFDSLERAEKSKQNLEKKYKWGKHGNYNYYSIFPLPKTNEVAEEYREFDTDNIEDEEFTKCDSCGESMREGGDNLCESCCDLIWEMS